MPGLFQHSRHLVRVVALFGLGLVLFVAARAIFIPKSFGELGHYRKGALDDVRKRTPVYAGKKACVECHTDVPEQQKGSRHAQLSCEACHGAQGIHASDPSQGKPEKPADVVKLCLLCHEANVTRPAGFKQIKSKDHNPGAKCTDCHPPHVPLEPETAPSAHVKEASK